MQRWFFIENPNYEAVRRKHARRGRPAEKPQEMAKTYDPVTDTSGSLEVQWIVKVKAELCTGPNVTVCLTGNISQLGNWQADKVIPLNRADPSDPTLWSVVLEIPNLNDTQYRYCICYLADEPRDNLVLLWETNLKPRVLKKKIENEQQPDTFGDYEGKQNITRSWLTTQTLIQFKFFNYPLKLKSTMSGRDFHIKVTPVKLVAPTEDPCPDETSLNADTGDVSKLPRGVFVEAVTLDNNFYNLKPQGQFGHPFKPSDNIFFNILTLYPHELAYLVDFYSYSSRAAPNDPPSHVAYTYVIPSMFKPSDGSLELPVTCNVKHRLLGTVSFQYLIVRPMPDQTCDMSVSYAKYWEPTWQGLDVGHRGLGASFKNKEGNLVRENTIASLKKAAQSGADMLEFDVQLSKDMVPVIYHDFHICISMKKKRQLDYTEMLELPVKDLSLEQMQKLKVYHLVEGRTHEPRFFDEHLEEHQPFPTLKLVLETIDKHVGFNVELKWTMEMDDGTFELNNPFDMNTYVDKVLEVVLRYAGDRRIVFSGFNPDICTLVRYKQNKYPVMFLTVGKTKKYKPYRDVRCLSTPAAVQNAVGSDILGIVAHTEDLLRDPTQVKLAIDAGLVIFCWGDENNNTETIKRLKIMGLHAVIYDKLDQYSTKEAKESIFLLEARDSQRDLLRMSIADIARHDAVADADAESVSTDEEERLVLDLAHRAPLPVSAATSLESLTSLSHKRGHDRSATSLTSNQSVGIRRSLDKGTKKRRD